MAQADLADLVGLLRLIDAAQQAGIGRNAALELQADSFSPSVGFTWVDILRCVDCDERRKVAKCVTSSMSTMVTSQVIENTDECEFVLRVVTAEGESEAPIFVGVVNDVPTGFETHPIGHPRLLNSIGICGYPSQGAIVHDGKTLRTTPGIKSGDIIKIKVSRGSHVRLFHGSRPLHAFSVGGDGKFRCAVSISSKGQHVEILDQVVGGSDPGLDLLRMLLEQPGTDGTSSQSGLLRGAALAAVAAAAAAQQRQGGGGRSNDDAAKLPKETYSPSKGFTWVDTLRSVDCDRSDKVATCVTSRTATMVSAQVLSKDDECEFAIKVQCAGGQDDQPIMFGVVDDEPTGFRTQPIGHEDFPGSFGACCWKTTGFLMHNSQKKSSCPGVGDDDVLKVRVAQGCNVSLWINSESILDFKVGGKGTFRIGVTFTSRGQQVEILDAAALAAPREKAMKVGCEIDMPVATDPRLSKMRTKFCEDGMRKHCSRKAKVVKVSSRCVRTSLDGREFWWDTELFPRAVRRCCPKGCDLQEVVLSTSSKVCDVCHVLLPIGASVLQCKEHDHDVCAYCQGITEVPPIGSKVIRGPTWQWKGQDGTPHAEGVVKSAPEEKWLQVQWANGDINRYRVDEYYQDVWLARDNGLKGKAPYPEDREERSLDGSFAERLLREIIQRVEERPAQMALPALSHSMETGFTFVESPLPEVIAVGESKKDARALKVHPSGPSRFTSLVTEQVVPSDTPVPLTFAVQIKALPFSAEGLFAWGICTSQARGFQHHIPGTKKFEGSIGCVCTGEGSPCVALKDDKLVKVEAKLPEVAAGDVIGARICARKCELLHQGRVIHRVGVEGSFRFVVCLGAVGQHVCIQSSLDEAPPVRQDFAKVVPHVEVGSGCNDLSFDESAPLGEGGFGVVYPGKLWGGDVVVKKMSSSTMTQEMERNFEQEVQALAALRHQNLMIFLAINAEQHLIVTEYCGGGDLKVYLLKGAGVLASAENRRQLMLDVVRGMACIAGRGMVHRDLKPENVLVSLPRPDCPVAKIGDFGLVQPLSTCRSEGKIAGSLLYMAPEVFIGQVGEKSDVYSFSLVLGFTFGMEELDVTALTNVEIAMLLAHLQQEPSKLQNFIIEAIRNGRRPAIPDMMPSEIKVLVQEGWDETPSHRPSFISLGESLTQPLLDTGFDPQALARSRQEDAAQGGVWTQPQQPHDAAAVATPADAVQQRDVSKDNVVEGSADCPCCCSLM